MRLAVGSPYVGVATSIGHHTIAPCRLRFVKRRIQALEPTVNVLFPIVLGHAEADRHLADGFEDMTFDGCTQVLRDFGGAVVARADEHAELSAPPAKQRIRDTQTLAYHLSKLTQYPIALYVAMLVVDAFEIVDVEENQCERLMTHRATGQLELNHMMKVRAVPCTG